MGDFISDSRANCGGVPSKGRFPLRDTQDGGDGDAMTQIKASMNELRHQRQLCDGEICCGPYRFPIHKVFLAAHSPYFRARFTVDMKDSDKVEVDCKTEVPWIMATILEFIYTHRINLNYKNVWEILPVADRLLVCDLKEVCSKFLVKHIKPNNALKIRTLADYHNCNDLFHKAETFILHNLPTVANSSYDFRQMLYEDLVKLLDDSRLRITTESQLYESIMLWVTYDLHNRKSDLASLLRRVRMAYLPMHYFKEHVLGDPVVAKRLDCAAVLEEARQYIRVIETGGGFMLDLHTGLAKARVPREVLFAVGGWSMGSPVACFETYDPWVDRWYKHIALGHEKRAYHGMAVLNNHIYVLGGFDGTKFYNSMQRFDPAHKQWTEAAPMYHPRCYLTTAVMGGLLYACGGYDGRVRTAGGERYNPTTNQWSLIADMNCRRSDAGAGELDGYLYVVGGYDGESCLSSVDRYDPAADQWTLMHPLVAHRSGVSVVAYSGALYVFGGFNGETRLCTVERYSPTSDRWQNVAPMSISRSNFAAAVLEGSVFVTGGYNGENTVDAVECYDPVSDSWRMKAGMTGRRSALKAVVLRDLPNVEDYSFHGNDKLNRSWSSIGSESDRHYDSEEESEADYGI